MGVHIGETEERDGDYFGPVVNLTARLEAAGHGGQTLITEHARAAARLQDTTTDLGVHHLKDVPQQVHIHQLGNTRFPDLRTVAERKTNLPATRTRLIGREEPLAQIRRLLLANRLVTVTAVGGSGKTRLAVAVGEEELDHRSDGVWFVDLTAVMSSDDVPSAVANAMGLMLTVGDPTAQVIAFLGDKAALLILDNCEHVIDACADFTEALLGTRGESVVLATSREALDLDGEQIVQLPSLTSTSHDTSSLSPAVQLFVEPALSINPGFVLDSDAQGSVESLCQHLDGMPLAIELAAARTNVLNPAELLAGLDDRFSLLSGGRRRQRERTLQATLDWSYDLLEPEQQRVFRTLGVFVGGADLNAIAAVAGLSRPAALDIVDALVAKSLVVRNADSDVTFRVVGNAEGLCRGATRLRRRSRPGSRLPR